MPATKRLPPVFLWAIFLGCCGAGALEAYAQTTSSGLRPPAGQTCPEGAFVIGFDNANNILCSKPCPSGELNDSEYCDDGNTESADRCSSNCQSESPVSTVSEPESTVETPPPVPAKTATVVQQPVISKVKPWSVVYGAREVAVTIFGDHFNSDTTVSFNGVVYEPTVNQAGTELQVTLETRGLPIGKYKLTVSNGPGMELTWKRRFEVF